MRPNSITSIFTAFALLTTGYFATAAPAPMGTGFTYQGRLSAGGQPANNVYDFIFTLHDDPTNAVTLGGGIVTLPSVPVTNGLFTVELNANGEFGPDAFNGSARWLEIGVRTNTPGVLSSFIFLAPRQRLSPAPAALFASNAVQAVTADSATTAQTANSATTAQTADTAMTAQTANTAATAQTANIAITAQTAYVANSVAWANISGMPAGFADGVDNDTVYTAGPGLSLSGTNQLSVNFSGSGSADTAAHSDHNHFGANWTGNSSGFGLIVVNNSTSGTGLYAQQGTGSGTPAPFGYKAAVWGEASQGDAVYGASGGAFGSGISGRATHPNGANFGVYGASDSTQGHGVFGYATSHGGTNYGVFGLCNSTNGGLGVYGRLLNPVANQQRKLWLQAGVQGESSQYVGVAGLSDSYYGVYGSSRDYPGVAGTSVNDIGVSAISSAGVGLSAYSASNNVVEGYTQGAFIFPIRVFRVARNGNVYAGGSFNPNGADFAEMLPAADGVEPGDVLVIGEDGKLARTTQPYQENVAGVHATKPGLLGGAHEGADLTGKIPLAIVGVVPVKVTSENGAIKAGDKLTSSSTPGHAMKAARQAEIGTVIGKALEGFSAEHGVIQMLVVLQ